MISKEELQQLYYYVGNVYYKHKRVRVYRTKTQEHKYVFYYDNNGDLSLMGFRDSNELAKQLTPDIDFIREKIEFQDEFISVETLFPETYFKEKPQTQQANEPAWISIKEKSMKARIVPTNENGTTYMLEIKDSASDSSYVCKMPIEFRLGDESNKDKEIVEQALTSMLIGTLEDYEKYKISVLNPDSTKILKRHNGVKILLCNEASFATAFGQQTDDVMGYYRSAAQEIAINFTQTKNFKNAYRHELGHAMSDNTKECQESSNGSIGFVTRRATNIIDGVAANESITVLFADDTEGYPDLIAKVSDLFDGKISNEIYDAYFNNNLDKFYEETANATGCTKDQATQLWLSLDLYQHATNFITALNQVELVNKQIASIKINQAKVKGHASLEELQKITTKYRISATAKESFVNKIISRQEQITSKGTSVPSEYSVFLQDMHNPKVKVINQDYAHYFALTSDTKTIIENINEIYEKFDARNRIETQAKILSDPNVCSQEYIKIFENLYETNKDYYMELLKTAIIEGAGSFVKKGVAVDFVTVLYDYITPEEKAQVLIDVSKVAGTKKFDEVILNYIKKEYPRIQTDEFPFFINEQVARNVIYNIIEGANLKDVNERIDHAQSIFFGSDEKFVNMDSKKIANIAYRQFLGEKGYNQIVDQLKSKKIQEESEKASPCLKSQPLNNETTDEKEILLPLKLINDACKEFIDRKIEQMQKQGPIDVK